MASKISISSVNELDYSDFILMFGNDVEGNPLCVAAVFSKRPFSSFNNFVAAMCQFIIDDLPKHCKAGILRGFLDLVARCEYLSCESQRE